MNLDEKNQRRLIAILINRLGGKVEIGPHEMMNIRLDDEIVEYRTEDPPRIVYRLRRAPVDAEFTVVSNVPVRA